MYEGKIKVNNTEVDIKLPSSNIYHEEEKVSDVIITINEGLSELEQKKIGYVKKNENVLEFYDTPKMGHLIGAVGFVSSNGGGVTEEYVGQVINMAMQLANQQIAESYYNKDETDERYALKGEGGEGGSGGSGASIDERNTLVDLLESVLFKDENILTKWNDFKNAWGDGAGTDEPVDPPSGGDNDDPVNPPVDPPADDDETIINGFIAKTIPINTDALDRDYPDTYQTEYNDEDYVYVISKGLNYGTLNPSHISTPYCTGWQKKEIAFNNITSGDIWHYPSVQNSTNYPHWFCQKIDMSDFKTWYETNEAISVGGKYILYKFNKNYLDGVYGYDSSLSVENARTYLLKEEPTLEEFLIVKGGAINDL